MSGSIPERRAPVLRRVLRMTRSRWIAAPIAASAALIAGLWLNVGPAWQLHDVTGSGFMRVDERDIPLADTSEVARALRAGARIELPDAAQLELELPGIVRLQVVGGSRFVLPASPGRWYGREMHGALDAGELRVKTGPRWDGANLAIVTPDARAAVTGTTFAVFSLPDASCVCVLEGAVTMSGPAAARDTVHAGFRRVVYRDGRPPLMEPILPMERMKLEMLRGPSTDGLQR